MEVAQWMEDSGRGCGQGPARGHRPRPAGGPEYRRLAIDVDSVGLGCFFAAKFRSGVLYTIHERTGDRAALEEALKAYRGARGVWAQMADRAKGVYVPDIAVGELAWLKGHWLDRLPAIDDDIAQMELRLASAKVTGDPRVEAAIRAALGRPKREAGGCRHQPAGTVPAQGAGGTGDLAEKGMKLASARLYYRHVSQAERFQSAEMEQKGDATGAAIPGSYTTPLTPCNTTSS